MSSRHRGSRLGMFISAFLLTSITVPAAADDLLNCGYPLDVTSPPSRIVTIKSSATDLLLALGLGDRIVGHAFQDGPPMAGFEAATEQLRVLSDRLPSRETVLATTPDFVFAGWESNVSGEGVGPREMLEGYGIRSYVAPAACRTVGRPERVTFESLFAEIEEAGRIFGATEPAEQLVASQREMLGQVDPIERPLKAVWYSSGSDVPYVGAGSGMPQAIMEALGLENIASDIDDGWSSVSWEAVAAAEPDLFILVDASWSSMQRKIGIIEASPLLAKLGAVQNQRFLTIPFAASEPGVRSIPATVELAKQLRDLIDE